MTLPLSPIVIGALGVYLLFSIWNAYSTGSYHAMLRKHKVQGVIQYGPYLSLTVSFIGIMLAVFLFYEVMGYYVGFIRINLPSDLANLDFATFLINQFSDIKLVYRVYVIFLALGLIVSATISLLTVRFAYRKGLAKIARLRAQDRRSKAKN